MGNLISKNKSGSKKVVKKPKYKLQRKSSSSSLYENKNVVKICQNSHTPKVHKVQLTFQPSYNIHSKQKESHAKSRNLEKPKKRTEMKFDLDIFEQGCLDQHNQLRARHDAPPLSIRSDLTNHARWWAAELAKKGTMVHSTDSDFGENLAFTTKSNVTPEEVCRMWYDEILEYDFEKATFSPKIGHFTQLVWKDSKFVGFGYARKGGKTFVTANYDPPGNYVGMFESNVIYGKGPLTRLEQNKPTHKKEEKQVEGQGIEKTTVDVQIEEFVDEEGRSAKKTTTTTTTVTTIGKKVLTKKKTETYTEYLDS